MTGPFNRSPRLSGLAQMKHNRQLKVIHLNIIEPREREREKKRKRNPIKQNNIKLSKEIFEEKPTNKTLEEGGVEEWGRRGERGRERERET